MARSNLIDQMKLKAEAAQALVHRITGSPEAFQYAVDVTAEQGGKTLAAIGFNESELNGLRELCESRNIELLQPPLRACLERIHTALTPADWGIAETGTLVIDSSSEDLRIATMLSEIHVAVLAAERIRAESFDLRQDMEARQSDPPRYLAFISGASRTADIERVLAIGVHGPQELHILIQENPS